MQDAVLNLCRVKGGDQQRLQHGLCPNIRRKPLAMRRRLRAMAPAVGRQEEPSDVNQAAPMITFTSLSSRR